MAAHSGNSSARRQRQEDHGGSVADWLASTPSSKFTESLILKDMVDSNRRKCPMSNCGHPHVQNLTELKGDTVPKQQRFQYSLFTMERVGKPLKGVQCKALLVLTDNPRRTFVYHTSLQ